MPTRGGVLSGSRILRIKPGICLYSISVSTPIRTSHHTSCCPLAKIDLVNEGIAYNTSDLAAANLLHYIYRRKLADAFQQLYNQWER